MVSVQYVEGELSEEISNKKLEGSLVLCGLDREESMRVRKRIEWTFDSSIPYGEFIRESLRFIFDGKTRKKYNLFHSYLQGVYEGIINNPFFVFIGGAASSGKSTLASYLADDVMGFDRIVGSDSIRENLRSKVREKYGGVENVPERLKPIFKSFGSLAYRRERELQNSHVMDSVEELFLSPYNEEFSKWAHPFYVLEGINVTPGIEMSVEGNNKLFVLIKMDEEELSRRIYTRQIRERRPHVYKDNERRLLEEELKRERINTLNIQRDLLKQAVRNDSQIIDGLDDVSLIKSFGDVFISQLEKILLETPCITDDVKKEYSL